MEVISTSPPSLHLLDMNMNNNNNDTISNCSTPYMSAPSSPQRPFNNFFFYSAPTSPRNLSSNPFFSGAGENSGAVEEDYEFEFSGQLDKMVRPSLSSADELFDGGKIRPLKPPPAMTPSSSTMTATHACESPRSPMSKFRDALSPKHRKKKLQQVVDDDEDPFEVALEKSRKEMLVLNSNNESSCRGRTSASCGRKGVQSSRSLSPLRVSEFANYGNSNGGDHHGPVQKPDKKWRLKDFLLFRSASEGRAGPGKDPLRKYFFALSSTNKKGSGSLGDDQEAGRVSSGSFRSMDGGSVSKRRGGGQQVSAHELHYTANRAVSEELKKKTSLPYKHGLLGCLGFNPAVHDISKAFGSFARS